MSASFIDSLRAVDRLLSAAREYVTHAAVCEDMTHGRALEAKAVHAIGNAQQIVSFLIENPEDALPARGDS